MPEPSRTRPHPLRSGGRRASGLDALRSPRYRRFWFGSLASVGATQLLVLGQGWLVFELSGSPLDLGLLGAASSLPAILTLFFGGILADRLDKRRVLITTAAIIATLLLLLAVLDATGAVTVGQVLAIVAVIALVQGIDWPARQAIFPSLIERRQMMSAVALNSILWQGTRMIMPAIGGVVIAATDTSVVFFVSAVGFLYMAIVLATLDVDRPAPVAAASMSQLAEGLRFIATHRLFAVLIPLTWVSMLFGTSYIQLMPVFAASLGVGERGFGMLVSATGVGSVLGTVLVSTLQGAPRLGWIMLGGLLISTLGLIAFGLVIAFAASLPGAYYLALGCVFAYSAFASVFLISSMTALQMRLPDRLRGRVMGIHGITFSLIPLGGLFGGTVAAASRPSVAVIVGATVVALSAAWVLLTQKEVRDLDGRRHVDSGASS